jgi:hypothetical protein
MGAAHLVCFISLCIVIHVVVGTLLTVEGPFYVYLKFSLQRISVYSGFKGFLFIQVSKDFSLFRFQRISVYSGFKGFLFIQVSKDYPWQTE